MSFYTPSVSCCENAHQCVVYIWKYYIRISRARAHSRIFLTHRARAVNRIARAPRETQFLPFHFQPHHHQLLLLLVCSACMRCKWENIYVMMMLCLSVWEQTRQTAAAATKGATPQYWLIIFFLHFRKYNFFQQNDLLLICIENII